MPKENDNRVNVAVERETYKTFSKIARLLGMTLKDAAEQALAEWSGRNASGAQKEARQLSKVAA